MYKTTAPTSESDISSGSQRFFWHAATAARQLISADILGSQDIGRSTFTLYEKNMSKYGAQHPEIIDFLTHKDDVCSLYIVQSDPLDDELTLKLQEKINNYLAYALDGQLAQEYPNMANMKMRIEIDIQHQPEGVAADFLNMVRPHIESEGIEFLVKVGGSNE